MGLKDRPDWIEYCKTNNRPSLLGYISWSNKIYAGETSQKQQHQHENMMVVIPG